MRDEKSSQKEKRKEIFENWIWKVFPNRKKRGKKKNTSKKEKRYKHKKPKSKGRWVNALALYGEEGRDYLRKAATSWK